MGTLGDSVTFETCFHLWLPSTKWVMILPFQYANLSMDLLKVGSFSMHFREIRNARTPPRNQETLGTRPVHLARIHGQLDSVLVIVLHHLADSIVGEDADAEEAVGTSVAPERSAHAHPSGTSRPPLEQSKDVLVAAAHAAGPEATAAEVFLKELQAAVLLASQTEHVLVDLPRGTVWQNRQARLWLETQCCSG